MDFIYAALILLLVAIAIFLGQIAIQFIKLERKLETTVEILEEELVDVFGTSPIKSPEAPKETTPAPVIFKAPPKPPAGREGAKGGPERPNPQKSGGAKAPRRK